MCLVCVYVRASARVRVREVPLRFVGVGGVCLSPETLIVGVLTSALTLSLGGEEEEEVASGSKRGESSLCVYIYVCVFSMCVCA